MNRRNRFAIVFAAVMFIAGALFAVTDTTDGVTVAELRKLKADVEADTGLSVETREQIIGLCDGAIASLAVAEDNRAAAAEFGRNRRDVERFVADLKAELDRPAPLPRLSLADDATLDQAEDALARERARLEANVRALREQQRLADERTKTRSSISQRLGELDLKLELLNRELRAQVDSTARLELKTARQLNVRARIEAANAEIEMLRARLALLADRSALIPLNTDLAQRRVTASEELVAIHARRAEELRREQARSSLARVSAMSAKLQLDIPQVSALARETEELARVLWGDDGVVALSEITLRDLGATRNHQSQLDRIGELTTRKFDAYGHRGSIQRWWPDIPDDFPETGAITKIIRNLDEEIPEVEHQLITYEQQRANAHELSRETIDRLATELGDRLTPDHERRVRALLATRQDLLDRLIQSGARYANLLVEYRTVSENFLSRVQEVERFLYAHVLWSRSVPRPIIPTIGTLFEGLRWVTSIRHARDLSITGIEIRGTLLVAVLLLVLTLVIRRQLRQRLHRLADHTSDPGRDNLGVTFRALLNTALLAAPLPLALAIVGLLVDRIGTTPYWFAAAKSLLELAAIAALLEAVRQIFAPKGLAEAHFGWPVSATKPLHHGLLLAESIALPLLYVALQLAFAGMRLNSPDELQLHNNSLGRLAFIGGLLVLGLSILAMLRPERKPEPGATDMRVPWPSRFSEYAFPTAFLVAYPLVVLATIVPAILALFGYYVTGLLLAYQMLRTLGLALAVLVAGGMVHRARIIRQKKLHRAADGEPDSKSRLAELEQAEKQVRHLFRFAVIVVLAVGLLSIWSDALPMLQLLKRVQLLPRIEIIEVSDSRVTSAEITSNADFPDSPPGGESGGAGGDPAAGAQMPGSIDRAPTEDSLPGSQVLTLWRLIEAVLAALVAVVLVKNLPGVIEITLQRQTTLDAGARFAFSTLVKYSTSIIGTIVVFGLLGIGWSKIQWLAAALTFGLGFGLQEIVANFVSGLILLVERPVRVGDVVTIGNLMGKVSRIQIRATTITLWDRSEMIVPNKEFITTKLVNWTLSDSKRRIEIPLRVAYGADLEEVKSLLVAAAETHPLVLDDPAPHALLIAFGDDAINFELRFVVDFGNGIQAKDDVQMAIDRAFKEKGIEFAVPQLKLQLPESVHGADDR
jgi:potassium efflux system protein